MDDPLMFLEEPEGEIRELLFSEVVPSVAEPDAVADQVMGNSYRESIVTRADSIAKSNSVYALSVEWVSKTEALLRFTP